MLRRDLVLASKVVMSALLMTVLWSAAVEEADEGSGHQSQASPPGAWAISSWTRWRRSFPELLPRAFWGGDWVERALLN
ncbi:hypothetical protein NL676_029986 [Syzygium grande]|nr:hypothetical protein NL676_029986 [Syzygium grande]